MKTRLLRSAFVLAFAPVSLALALGGCGTDPGADPDGTLHCNNDQSLLIAHFAPLITASMCLADPMGSTTISSGVLDTGIIAGRRDKSLLGYWLAPVVQNNLIELSTGMNGERNTVQLVGYNVEVHAPLMGKPPHYYVPAPGGIIPAAGGRAASVAQVIPSAIALQLATIVGKGNWDGRVVLRIQAVGIRGGSYMYGACTEFPVIVCNNCLLSHADIDTGAAKPCGAGLAMNAIDNGGCILGQDAAITCCSPGPGADGTSSLLCGPEVPRKTM